MDHKLEIVIAIEIETELECSLCKCQIPAGSDCLIVDHNVFCSEQCAEEADYDVDGCGFDPTWEK